MFTFTDLEHQLPVLFRFTQTNNNNKTAVVIVVVSLLAALLLLILSPLLILYHTHTHARDISYLAPPLSCRFHDFSIDFPFFFFSSPPTANKRDAIDRKKEDVTTKGRGKKSLNLFFECF